MLWKFFIGFIVLAAIIWSSLGLLMLATGALCAFNRFFELPFNRNFLVWQKGLLERLKRTPLRHLIGTLCDKELTVIENHLSGAHSAR